MEIEEKTKDQLSSVEFETNTKGYFSFKVKIYDEDPYKALAIAKDIAQNSKDFCDAKNGGA